MREPTIAVSSEMDSFFETCVRLGLAEARRLEAWPEGGAGDVAGVVAGTGAKGGVGRTAPRCRYRSWCAPNSSLMVVVVATALHRARSVGHPARWRVRLASLLVPQ